MTTRLLVATTILFFLSSCQKTEMAQPGAAINTTTSNKTAGFTALNKGVVSNAHWYGNYYDAFDANGWDLEGDPDGIPDNQLISGGVATVPVFVGAVTYFSFIAFDMPDQNNIPGDSLSYDVVVKNPPGNGLADYDVVLTIQGAQHTAEVHFVADAAYQSADYYSLGTYNYTNLPSLVNYFSDFETVKLVTKQGQTAVYVNNKLLYRFKYSAANAIGRVSAIQIAGKGSAVVDNVLLTNSYTNKKLMQENFNTDGQSHTIFY